MSTSLSIPYCHTIEFFSKGIDQGGGPYYRVQYLIDDWSQADAFCNALMGIGTVTGGSGGTIVRSTPHQHPLSPNLTCCSAHVVEGLGQPVLNSSGYPDYDGGALIQAEYRASSIDFSVTPNALLNQIDESTPILWCTQELEFSTSSWTIDAKYHYGTTTGTLTDVPVRIEIPITTLNLTFHRLPYMPMTKVRSLRGRVNSTTFLGAAAGTVLFKGARTHRDFNSDGTVVQQVQLTFEERDAAHPWNALPSKTALTTPWTEVVDGSGNKMYRTGDLNTLLFS